jgi:hypothetical protein
MEHLSGCGLQPKSHDAILLPCSLASSHIGVVGEVAQCCANSIAASLVSAGEVDGERTIT